MRILIIDDDSSQLALLAQILRADAHEVLTAESASTALLATHGAAPELLFLDLYLSGPDGLELRDRMQAMGAIGNVPFVIMSSSDLPCDQKRSLEAGAEAYLVKPLDAERVRGLAREIETARANMRPDPPGKTETARRPGIGAR